MDYEKKYNEALERAKKILCNLGEGDGSIRDIETIFPELAESEDERIIKALETFINKPEIADKITFEARILWLSWLEKQKEQRPAWGKEDENALKYIHELISWGYSKKFMDAQTAHDMRKWINEHLYPDTFQNGNSRPKSSDNWKLSEELED